VAGNTTPGSSGPNDETGYNPTTGRSETLVINFGHLVLAATLGLSRFYSAAEGADQGKNEVMKLDFYREGEIVGSALVASDGTVSDATILSTVDTGNGLLEVKISNLEFDEIKISGLPYDDPNQPGIDANGQGNIINDSSDASLMYIDYTYRTESNPAGFDDKIWGDDGNDQLYGDQGNDEIHGGNGNDFISGGTGDDKLFGDAGNDVMHGDDGQDDMHGGSGNDIMFGDGGHDVMHGDAGNDMMFGYTGKDEMYGGDGDDFIYGEQDDDYAEGGNGKDTFDMGTGNDKAYGQAGDDTYIHDMRLFVRDPVTNAPYVEHPTLYDENMPASTLKQFVDAGLDFFDGGTGVDTIDLRGTASPMTEGPSNWLIHIDTAEGGINITAANFDDYQAYMMGNVLDINALSGGMNSGFIETTLGGSDNASENGLARLDFINVERILIEDGQIV
ncbi:MAG TPA: calcium-binding protein, partial [Candidatus Nitrosotenuis sp.]|nr:calcium-binding protein [Candidatus Nitrosotenuis sp.]